MRPLPVHLEAEQVSVERHDPILTPYRHRHVVPANIHAGTPLNAGQGIEQPLPGTLKAYSLYGFQPLSSNVAETSAAGTIMTGFG